MNTKPHQRAIGPTDQGTAGLDAPSTPERRADTGAPSSRTTLRDSGSHRRAGQMKASGAGTMDYQLGFFSGPSS